MPPKRRGPTRCTASATGPNTESSNKQYSTHPPPSGGRPKSRRRKPRRQALTYEQQRVHAGIREESQRMKAARAAGEWCYHPTHIPLIHALLQPAVTLACDMQRRGQWRYGAAAPFDFEGKAYRLRCLGGDQLAVSDPASGRRITTAFSPSLW